MGDVLADEALYEFTGGEPPSMATLRARYAAQVAGSSDAAESWHNWIIRDPQNNEAAGFVQATVFESSADVAWVLGLRWQGLGLARAAAAAMTEWLVQHGVTQIHAHIHPAHAASSGVAMAIGLRPTDMFDDDGERLWTSS